MNTTAAIAKNVGSIVTLVREPEDDGDSDTCLTFEVMSAGVVKVNGHNYGTAKARELYRNAITWGNYRRASFGCYTAAERAEINRQEDIRERRKANYTDGYGANWERATR